VRDTGEVEDGEAQEEMQVDLTGKSGEEEGEEGEDEISEREPP
jgi:hypothetical protein